MKATTSLLSEQEAAERRVEASIPSSGVICHATERISVGAAEEGQPERICARCGEAIRNGQFTAVIGAETVHDRCATPQADSPTPAKQARFDANPTCDACRQVIENVEDADLISNVIGSTPTAPREILIHKSCWALTLGKLATLARIPSRRRK